MNEKKTQNYIDLVRDREPLYPVVVEFMPARKYFNV